MFDDLRYKGNRKGSRWGSVEGLVLVLSALLRLRGVSRARRLRSLSGVAASVQSKLCRWRRVREMKGCGDVGSGVIIAFGPSTSTVLSSDAFPIGGAVGVSRSKSLEVISTIFPEVPLSTWTNWMMVLTILDEFLWSMTLPPSSM